ncbi:MAG: phosphatase PAP2 family protein [Spirochaetales bacterium]|nr:phosphatase PAP2 family protein [Candidatus Physcosoma equi]
MIQELMSIQLPLMEVFQHMGSSFLDVIGTAVTLFGEPYIAIPILIYLYWCIDKKKGAILATVVLTANYAMNVAKLLVRAPRPFQFAPEKIANKRASTATGFAFPSGHTTSASSLFGTLSRFVGKTWGKVLLLLIPVLVGLSRLYLGAHWPLDVIVGLALGLFFAFYGYDWFSKLYDNEEKFYSFMKKASCILGVTSLFSIVLLQFFHASEFIWKDFMEGSAMALGVTLSFPLERKHVHFTAPKTLKDKLLVFLVGTVIGIGLWFVLRSIPVLPYLFKFLGYFFLIIFVGYLYPLIGVKMGFFGQED